MKKQYEKPTATVIVAVLQDILLASGGKQQTGGELDNTGESAGSAAWDTNIWL